MGIYDRDYARPTGGGFGGGMGRGSGGPRSWTINTWIIVVCVAVFMLNAMLPQSYVPRGHWTPLEGVSASLPVADVSDLPLKSLSLGGLPDGQRFRAWQTVVLPVIYTSAEGGQTVVGGQPATVQGMPFVWGYFSTAKALVSTDETWGLVGFEFWRFLTFQFLHADLSHLLFNMIGLFFFGAIVEQFLGHKRYLAFYLLCGIAGACMYLLLNFLGLAVANLTGIQRIPFLLFDDPNTLLVGASAGVFGVIMAAAYLMPDAKVLLFFVIPMKLKTLAYGLVAMALFAVFFQWEGSNAGGEAAHIGGAIAGYYFVRRPHQLHGFFDFLGRFDPTSQSNKARKAGTVRSAPGGGKRSITSDVEVDRILDKINAKGLQSLSAKEKKMLREASRR
jgi:membrane associated rhomboid family serine protease